MRRATTVLLLLPLLLVPLLLIPDGVQARTSTVSVRYRTSFLLVRATNQDDRIQISETPSGRVRIDVGAATVESDDAECTSLSPGLLECEPALLRVLGRGGDDEIRLDTTLPSLLIGGGGDDLIVGGAGNDVIKGQSGADRLFGEGGRDTLMGGGGDDTLLGGADDDELLGQAGDDRLSGGLGADTLSGGGGKGDVADYRERIEDGFSVSFDGQPNDGNRDEADNVEADVEEVLPPEREVSSMAVLDGVLRIVDGEGAANTIYVLEGDGGAADEPLVLFIGGASPVVLGSNCEESSQAGFKTCSGVTRVEIFAGGGNDAVASLIDVPAEIHGGPGFDALHGGPNQDRLFGDEQADLIYGAGGNDQLFGGPGNDRLSGGEGVGTDADQIFGGPGTDIVTYFAHAGPVSVSFDDVADDGLEGEGDNVARDVERRATEFWEDLPVLGQGSELPVSGSAWSGSSTNFGIRTVAKTQVVAFYEVVSGSGTAEAKCVITVAARRLGSADWEETRLDWREQGPDPEDPPFCDTPSGYSGPNDTHNRLVLAFDRQGRLHLAGNMHNDYMRYWRSGGSVLDDPSQVATLLRYPVIDPSSVEDPYLDHESSGWVGAHFDPGLPYEKSVTYPSFHESDTGDLVLTYRLGSSSNGDMWAARFDPESATWSRTFDGPYLGFAPGSQPSTSPYVRTAFWEGSAHLLAVHREKHQHGGNQVNRNMAKVLTYARTRDWASFENAAGEPVALPVTQQSSDAMVESAEEGGIHRVQLGRQVSGNPTVGYPIYDHEAAPGGAFCPEELSASRLDRVLKARVAVFRDQEWKKVDLACSPWVWGRDNAEEGIHAGALFDFWVDAPSERILDGRSVFVSRVIIRDQPTRHFVIDHESLEVIDSLLADPGGTRQIPGGTAACGTFFSLVPVSATSPDFHEPGAGAPDGDWRTLYQKSEGDADAGDYYRLAHEVFYSPDWNAYDLSAPASRLRVRRTTCDKAR